MSLVLRDLRVERGGRTLLVADLAVDAGECAVLIGSAGTGKSSLAAAIAGVLPSSGVVEVAGRRLSGLPARRRRLGLAAVLPDESPAHGCSVAELLGLAARRPRTAAATLERFPLLGGRSGLDAGRLSGGERQLLRLATAWAGMPIALLLDGPAAGLADDVAADVREIAAEEARRGAAVLWLDQPDAPVPELPRWILELGRVRTSASASASTSLPEARRQASR